MKSGATLITTVLFLAIAFPLSTASAESIAIQSGSMIVDARFLETGSFDDRPTLEIRGTHGFVLSAIPEILSSNGPWQCRPCDVNNRVQVSNLQGGTDLPGTVEFEGTQYRLLNNAEVGLDFVADTLVFPPVQSRTQVAQLSEPFEVGGALLLPDVGGLPTPAIPLFGRGRVTIVLTANSGGAPVWEFNRASYVFGPTEPVPEPATIFLVGGAMVGAVCRWTRRRPA